MQFTFVTLIFIVITGGSGAFMNHPALFDCFSIVAEWALKMQLMMMIVMNDGSVVGDDESANCKVNMKLLI